MAGRSPGGRGTPGWGKETRARPRFLQPSAPPTRARSCPSAGWPRIWAGRSAIPPLAAARQPGAWRAPEPGRNAPSRPRPSALPHTRPPADVRGAPVAMVTNRGPVPPPPLFPGPLTSAHVSGGARLAGPCGAGGTERRSERSGRRPSGAEQPASLPAALQPALQSAVSSSGAQHGHGGWPEALAARAGPGGVLRNRGHAGERQLRRGEAGATPDHQDGGAARGSAGASEARVLERSLTERGGRSGGLGRSERPGH